MISRNDDDWVTATIGGEVVMLNIKRKTNISLDEMGGRIWEIIETPRTLDEICLLLRKEFAVPPDLCRAEVEQFLRGMETQGAVTFGSQSA